MLLAGGDYDGDDVIIVAHEPIVRALRVSQEQWSCDPMMHYNHDLILEMQQQFGAKGQPILTSAGEGPVEAIVYAHSQSSRCSILKGQLGNMWTRIPLRWANERGRALALHALDALLQFFKESELFSVARNSAWHCSLFGAALNAWRRRLRHRCSEREQYVRKRVTRPPRAFSQSGYG